MKKAFCTFGVGLYSECLDLARPGFERYCDLHGYTYIEKYPKKERSFERPPAWYKVLLLGELLEDYDVVVWLDCDTLILNYDDDVGNFVPPDCVQGITAHDFGTYDVPSTGLWYCRREMLPFLEQIWTMTRYLQHSWWEQRAMQELLGYDNTQDSQFVVRRMRGTELYNRTYFLDVEWNSIDYTNLQSKARIMHFPAMFPHERISCMEKWRDARLI